MIVLLRLFTCQVLPYSNTSNATGPTLTYETCVSPDSYVAKQRVAQNIFSVDVVHHRIALGLLSLGDHLALIYAVYAIAISCAHTEELIKNMVYPELTLHIQRFTLNMPLHYIVIIAHIRICANCAKIKPALL